MLFSQASKIQEIASKLRECELIGVDTEFVRETTFVPQLALIQVATDKEQWLIDPVGVSRETLAPLLDVLTDKKILKIMHASFADQECFYSAYRLVAEPVLDTSVGAALCGIGDNISLEKLVREALGIHLKKGRARTNWLKRPLPAELEEYGKEDVRPLVALGKWLIAELKARHRLEWALEESHIASEQFESDPKEFANRLARGSRIDALGYSCLVELVTWRENRARSADLPRTWVMHNETLVSLAKTRPRRLEELGQFRGVKPRELKTQGDIILQCIRRGEEAKHAMPKSERLFSALTPQEEVMIDFVRSFVAYLSEKHRISGKYLLTVETARQIVGRRNDDIHEWVRLGIISKWAMELAGNEIKSLLEGKMALVLRKHHLEAVEVKP